MEGLPDRLRRIGPLNYIDAVAVDLAASRIEALERDLALARKVVPSGVWNAMCCRDRDRRVVEEYLLNPATEQPRI